jgi:hypothetical protein
VVSPTDRSPPRGVEMSSDTDFSEQLEEWLIGDGPKTLGALGDVFGEKSFAVTVLFLMFVPALPLPTGGVTHVFEVITVLIAAQMILGRRTIWLPQRWQRRELGGLTTGKAVPFMIRRIRWFEKFSRPRAARLIGSRWFLRLLGLVLIGFAVAAALAPPFSGLDTLPALGAVAVALSIILEDVVVLGIGLAIGIGGIALIVTVGATLLHFLRSLF